jgi:3D-(3,5/4)-trihydroxycyclohexane-1,2-dione acylhydrolase (decyclizing)
VLTDPADCGPVTLAFCQDVQTQAADYPATLFEPHIWTPRRPRPDTNELAEAVRLLRAAKRPLVVAGGGVLYAEADAALAAFCARHGIPAGETQSGKSSLPASHAQNMGALGVTGTQAANDLAAEADVILAVGTRLQDFTTGSRSLFEAAGRRIVGLNVQPFDAGKHGGVPLVADALAGLQELEAALSDWRAPSGWTQQASEGKRRWADTAARYTAAGNDPLPSDAQVIGAIQRQSLPSDIVLNAAGGAPGELHKHWQAEQALGYHMEYGFSCMGYEIAGGLGVKMALPDREVIVLVGDGSYLMLNSELPSTVMLGKKLIVVILDNRGYGCINRLQRATGGESFNNLLADTVHEALPDIDFAAHARSLGAIAEKVASLADLEAAVQRARRSPRTHVIVIDTDPLTITDAGGHWWDVAVPEVSVRPAVRDAHAKYVAATAIRDAVG